ncbi:hypothetical protein Y1Q_0015473 [Alligator mississippiensis]|uniref:Uncharacterized protein n=1 Tax=Alligator mississippiensis TaxID=8496 RepID=A0A151NCZ9_ALLMI|nr:hypothetical protein Y1Q_0015473 [Alligator mississippiensis]
MQHLEDHNTSRNYLMTDFVINSSSQDCSEEIYCKYSKLKLYLVSFEPAFQFSHLLGVLGFPSVIKAPGSALRLAIFQCSKETRHRMKIISGAIRQKMVF